MLAARVASAGATGASTSGLAMIEISRAIEDQNLAKARRVAKEHLQGFEQGIATLREAAESVRKLEVAPVFSAEERKAIQAYIAVQADLIEAKLKSMNFLVRFAKTGDLNWMRSYYRASETISGLEMAAREEQRKVEQALAPVSK